MIIYYAVGTILYLLFGLLVGFAVATILPDYFYRTVRSHGVVNEEFVAYYAVGIVLLWPLVIICMLVGIICTAIVELIKGQTARRRSADNPNNDEQSN